MVMVENDLMGRTSRPDGSLPGGSHTQRFRMEFALNSPVPEMVASLRAGRLAICRSGVKPESCSALEISMFHGSQFPKMPRPAIAFGDYIR